jgi:acyl-CoA synthetase (AMP-forming)/AMP-acid ligase II
MQIEGESLASPAAPLDDLLRVGLDAAPDATALVSIARSMSWRELEDASAPLAGGYRSLGLKEGDRVGSLMPNRIDLVVHYLACFKAGLVATPLNYRYTFREIDHADVILFCRDRVGYKAPEEIIFLDEIPLNPTGKIDRVGLNRLAEDHLHPHVPATS